MDTLKALFIAEYIRRRAESREPQTDLDEYEMGAQLAQDMYEAAERWDSEEDLVRGTRPPPPPAWLR